MDKFRTFADRIGQYVMEKFVKPNAAQYVSYYRATVTQAASSGKITVQKPFDNPVALPYVGSAAGLTVGSQCVVLVFGSESNACVLGDGTLSNL